MMMEEGRMQQVASHHQTIGQKHMFYRNKLEPLGPFWFINEKKWLYIANWPFLKAFLLMQREIGVSTILNYLENMYQ
jgi:hypothetical protein